MKRKCFTFEAEADIEKSLKKIGRKKGYIDRTNRPIISKVLREAVQEYIKKEVQEK